MKNGTLQKILDIGIALSKEKDTERLLEYILTAVMDITQCDGGTLYIKEDETLEFKIMITKSRGIHQGGSGDAITMPPVSLVKENVCACGVLYRRLINIPDVYESSGYDFSGPKKYDAITGYQTKSMMVVPMEDDKGTIIGVMQLINAMDESGNVIPFREEYEQILLSVGSQAAICLMNMNYAKQIRNMLDSFVRVMSTAIDARSPYTANHTRNMVAYASRFIDWLNQQDTGWNFDEKEKYVFLMSAWLHDIGKLITPQEVMDKRDRLAGNYTIIMDRFEKIRLLTKIEALQGKVGEKEAADRFEKIQNAGQLVTQVNECGFLTDELAWKVNELAGWIFEEEDGSLHPWITQEEQEQLIIRKGTLTDKEREIMQDHVEMTRIMLEQMSFGEDYQNVVTFAAQHHERLNGSGYPKGLKEDEISREVRLLVILDIFEALTARERPYKPPIPAEKAFEILYRMASQVEIDLDILKLFEQSQAWILDSQETGERGL